MRVKTYLIADLIDDENSSDDSLSIYIDVLRASTTVCAALYNGAKEVIPVDSMDKAIIIHKNLSDDISVLAGERKGKKPLGFHFGNSPGEFTENEIKDKTIVLTTSNGTKAFNKLRKSRVRFLASFVNLDIIVKTINKIVNKEKIYECNIICAGNDGDFSFEDTICAGAILYYLNQNGIELELNDSSVLAIEIFDKHKNNLLDFIKEREHPKLLMDLGFENDIDEAFSMNKYPVLPVLSANSIRRGNDNFTGGFTNNGK
jgi:2-phosphosulfolactate phosphatase